MAAESSGRGEVTTEHVVEAIEKLTRGIEHVLREAKDGYAACVNIDDFLRIDAKCGIRQMFRAMPIYAECMVTLGVKTRAEQDQLCSTLFQYPEVRECYDALLNTEEAFNDFSKSVNVELQKEETKMIPRNVTTTGSRLPEELSLVDATTGDEVGLTSLCARSTFTVMVLMRHFG